MMIKLNNILLYLNEFGIYFNEDGNNWGLKSSNDLHSFLQDSGIKGFYPFGLKKLNLDEFFSGHFRYELDPINNNINEIINSMSTLEYNDTLIYSSNYFEQLVSFEGGLYKTRYIVNRKKKIFDAESGIEFELSRPSLEYIFLSLQKLIDNNIVSIHEIPSLIKEAFFDDGKYIRAINEEERFKNNLFKGNKSIQRSIKYYFQIKTSKLLIEIKIVESELESILEIIDALKFFRDLGPENTEKLNYDMTDDFDGDVIKKFKGYKRYYKRLDHNKVNGRIKSYERRKSMFNGRLRRLKNFENFLSEGIFGNIWTLKVRSKSDLKLNDFEDLSNTFLFYLNYNDLPVFKIYPRLFETLKSDFYSEFNFKIYKKELVYYYHRGLNTDDPTLSFLSFYHVLEFFCKKRADLYSVDDVRKLVKDPKFSPEDEKKVIKLINTVQKSQKKLNDKRKLKLVFEAYLDENEILNALEKNSKGITNHFEISNDNNFNSIINKYPLINKKGKLLMDNLVGRIYAIRNALVHSKEGEDYAFVPFSGDENALKKEIPLMRFLAEQIIIKTSINFE